MPTPTTSFLKVAEQFGKIDPDDIEAVQHWFTEVLLKNEGADKDEETARSYPRDVLLPSLSSSPPELHPLLAAGWREILVRLVGRGRKG